MIMPAGLTIPTIYYVAEGIKYPLSGPQPLTVTRGLVVHTWFASRAIFHEVRVLEQALRRIRMSPCTPVMGKCAQQHPARIWSEANHLSCTGRRAHWNSKAWAKA